MSRTVQRNADDRLPCSNKLSGSGVQNVTVTVDRRRWKGTGSEWNGGEVVGSGIDLDWDRFGAYRKF